MFRTFLIASLLFAAGFSADAAARRNVVFLIADDMNKRLPCYGDTLVQAPNLDRLAARAVRFDRAYCQYPVCSPSRVSFLSGRRPEHTGMYGNEGASRTPLLQDAVFLPEHFRKNGWFTARLGKVFHIGRDVPECWDVSEEGSPGPRPMSQPREVETLGLRAFVVAEHRLQGVGGEGASYAILNGGKEKLIDVINGARAAEIIRERAGKEQPFFLACGFRRPHGPHIAPQEFFDRYPASKMPLPESGGPKIRAIEKPLPDEGAREALRGYLACVTFMDEQVGKIFDALDAHKLWDNTVVVFIGDHGFLLGSRGGWLGKGQIYEEAASTALLVAAPGKAKGVGCARVVEFLDLYPTLNELCGLPMPAGLEGRSFAPLLADPTAPWDHVAYTMQAPGGRPKALGVTTERFRYLTHNDGRTELFNVKADPREWRNLLADPAHAADLAALQKLAEQYVAKFRKQ